MIAVWLLRFQYFVQVGVPCYAGRFILAWRGSCGAQSVPCYAGRFLYHFIVDIFMTINTLQDFTLYETQHIFA